MKKLSFTLVALVVMLTGCGATYTPEEVLTATNNFASKIGVENEEHFDETQHVNMVEYQSFYTQNERDIFDESKNTEPEIYFNFRYFQLDPGTSTSGFFKLVEEEAGSDVYYTCNGASSSIAIVKYQHDEVDDWRFIDTEFTEEEKQYLDEFADELGCKLKQKTNTDEE